MYGRCESNILCLSNIFDLKTMLNLYFDLLNRFQFTDVCSGTRHLMASVKLRTQSASLCLCRYKGHSSISTMYLLQRIHQTRSGASSLLYLDCLVDLKSQDSGRLVEFRNDVLQNDEKMNQYQHQWPIDAYSKIWGQYHRWRVAQKTLKSRLSLNKSTYHRITTANITRGKTGRRSGDSTRLSKVHKTRTLFVGKPPVRGRLVWKTKQRTNQGNEGEQTQISTQCQDSFSTMNSQSFPSSDSASIPIMQGAHQPSTTPTMMQGKPSILKRYPSPCAFCHFLPTIPNDIRSQLLKLFSDVPHVVSHLESSGLVHDLHLMILLCWDREDRQEFCNRLPQNLFSNLDLITITTRLVEHPRLEPKDFITTSTDTQQGGQQQSAEQCENVPWPDESAKRVLMTSSDILSELKRAMGKHGTDELLTRLTELVDQHGAGFLQNYRPYEQGSCSRLNDTVKMILKAEQRLSQFEDAWPIRFYLQRRAGDQSKRASQSKCIANALPTILNGHEHSVIATTHKGTGIFTDPECPTHLRPDLARVSESIINFFSKHSSQELLIPLALMGVRTDQQFALLRSMSSEQVESLVARTESHAAKASLNLFQSILLKILLRD